MRVSRVLFGLARLALSAFILLCSVYALLTFIPFTYQQVVKGDLLPWLSAFARLNSRLYWVALAIACATLAPDMRRGRARWLAILFAAVYAVAGALLPFTPGLAHLRPDISSLLWAMAALTPLLWIAAIDLVGYAGKIEWAAYRKEDDRRIFQAAWQTAVFLSLAYCCIFYARASVNWGPAERLVALLCTFLCHLLVFGVLFAALNLIRSVASLTPWPSQLEFLLCNLMTATIGWAILRTLVFRPVSFEGHWADGYGALLALSLIACIAGSSVRFWQPAAGPVDGLTLALRPLTVARVKNRLLQPVPLIVLAALAWVLAVNTAIMDWNYMFQKLTACAIWVLSFATLYSMAPRLGDVPDRRITILFWAAMVMTGYRLTAAAVSPNPKLGAALEKYAGYDASFRLIRDAIAAPPKNDTFYKFLSENTNIPRSVPTAPVDIDPAGALTPTPGPRPNVFFIVIDSLRRDYLGACNASVRFTPEVDEFARESVVFRNAFTRYGGTGLAEPSIWVGGMMLHKQYVTPFYPMNALAKLVEAEKYQAFVSMDSILRTVVKPPPGMVELDENRSGMDYRLCSSLDDLELKLGNRGAAAQPVFAYTQPQDIHISVINREKNSVVDGGSYPGFYAPYASRLHRMDACFGKFIQFLKAHGLFDNSLIVLTADHGDSLGEEGRWGHAYALVPEVVRIPLIVHLPKAFQGLHSDPRAVAFQSDMTPSLYYMLGHNPTLHEEFYGRPLFTRTAAEETATRRESYLIAASYASVYAILGDYGKSLAIFDAVNYKDSFYELNDSGPSPTSMMSSSKKSADEDLIRKRISDINAFYKFKPRH